MVSRLWDISHGIKSSHGVKSMGYWPWCQEYGILAMVSRVWDIGHGVKCMGY